jgi:DNA modification methylase
VEIGSILPDPKNARVHKREQVRAIARSIDAFGFNAPLLVDRDNRVIAGHGRLEAAKFLDLREVPVIRLEHLTPEGAKAYMLADNALAERSSWDDKQLALNLKELHELALDFDIEVTGFELPEIDLRIQSLGDPEVADAADEFQAPDGPAISRLGDVWHLGPHRILCGNALEPQSYELLLGDEKVGAVFTDPPYNVRVDGHVSGKGRRRHREFAMASGEMSREQFTQFLQAMFDCIRAKLLPGAVCFKCIDWRHLVEALTASEQGGFELLNLCVWSKTNGGMGTLYRSAHELVLVLHERGSKSRNNIQLGRFGRNRTNVWTYPGMNSFARQGRERALHLHPTVKPIGLVADALLDVTTRGDVVLDPFLGSGTTILAAERTGRRGAGIELDPLYVDTAIRRWQQMTEQEAMHANGGSFGQIAFERRDDVSAAKV